MAHFCKNCLQNYGMANILDYWINKPLLAPLTLTSVRVGEYGEGL